LLGIQVYTQLGATVHKYFLDDRVIPKPLLPINSPPPFKIVIPRYNGTFTIANKTFWPDKYLDEVAFNDIKAAYWVADVSQRVYTMARANSYVFEKLPLNIDKAMFPCRSAHKLLELFINFPGLTADKDAVLDVASPPGGWACVFDLYGFRSKLTLLYGPGDCTFSSLVNENIRRVYQDLLGDVRPFCEAYEAKYDLIVCDGSPVFEEAYEYNKENDSVVMIANELAIILGCLQSGGDAVIKLLGVNTPLTHSWIAMLTTCFKEVILLKPKTSRPASHEVYLIMTCYAGCGRNVLEFMNALLKAPKNAYVIYDNKECFTVLKHSAITLSNKRMMAMRAVRHCIENPMWRVEGQDYVTSDYTKNYGKYLSY